MKTKIITLFALYALTSVGLGLMFESIGAGMVSFGVMSAWTINAYIEGFHAGINWFLDNLWHDASEEPKIGKRVIVELKDREGQERFYISDRDPNFRWKAEVKVCGFIRWFYVEDLLKGGK